MRKRAPRSLADLLGDEKAPLGQLVRRASSRMDLNERFRRELPPALAEHVVSVSLSDGGEALIRMDSAAWARRLQYAERDARSALIRCGEQVNTLSVRVGIARRGP